MNEYTRVPRRGPKAAVRRERLLAEFKRSGLSAYAFSKRHAVAYTTLIQWLKHPSPLTKAITFTEVELPAPPSEPLTLELGPHVRLRLTSSTQMPLVIQLIKLWEA